MAMHMSLRLAEYAFYGAEDIKIVLSLQEKQWSLIRKRFSHVKLRKLLYQRVTCK